jgi:SNF2 family DNA or RNA helicase
MDKVSGFVSLKKEILSNLENLTTDHLLIFNKRIGIALKKNEMSFFRLDGELDSRMQDQCLADFKTSTKTHLLLASLQTAGVGLTITCASIAFIMVSLDQS